MRTSGISRQESNASDAVPFAHYTMCVLSEIISKVGRLNPKASIVRCCLPCRHLQLGRRTTGISGRAFMMTAGRIPLLDVPGAVANTVLPLNKTARPSYGACDVSKRRYAALGRLQRLVRRGHPAAPVVTSPPTLQ